MKPPSPTDTPPPSFSCMSLMDASALPTTVFGSRGIIGPEGGASGAPNGAERSFFFLEARGCIGTHCLKNFRPVSAK